MMKNHNLKALVAVFALFVVFGLGVVTASSGHGMFSVLNLEPHEISKEILGHIQEQVDDIKDDFKTRLELNEVEAETICMDGECHSSWDSVCQSWVESNSVD